MVTLSKYDSATGNWGLSWTLSGKTLADTAAATLTTWTDGYHVAASVTYGADSTAGATGCMCVVQWKSASEVMTADQRAGLCNCATGNADATKPTVFLSTIATKGITTNKIMLKRAATGAFTAVTDVQGGAMTGTTTGKKGATVAYGWYQPKSASTYTGTPRFDKDDWVNCYACNSGSADCSTPKLVSTADKTVGAAVQLTGAVALATGAILSVVSLY